MDIDLADLPDNVETLQRMVRTLATDRASLAEAQAEIERLRLIVHEGDKRQILEEAVQAGANLSEVTRRYGIAARVLFRWKQELTPSAARVRASKL